MPNRLLLLVTDLKLGGTPTVVRELAIRLRAAGGDVEVACLSPWGPVADQLRNAGVKVTALNARGPADVRAVARLVGLIRGGRFDTVFSFLIHANTAAAMAAAWCPHMRWVQSIQTTQPNPRWHWMVQRLVHRVADTIIVPSESVARVAREWADIPGDKVVVIPNAIDPADWLEPSPVPAQNPRPYPVVFVGRLDPVKDLPTLLSAVEILGDLVHLHVHGEGADRPRIESILDRKKLHGRVTLHGAVDHPQTALAAAGVLVLPSLAEGFGLVLIEAMAAGVPVVATDVDGVRDVVRHDVTGLLVPPGNPPALAAAIKRVVDDPALRTRLVESAAADVARRFSWTAVLAEYDRVLNASAPPG